MKSMYRNSSQYNGCLKVIGKQEFILVKESNKCKPFTVDLKTYTIVIPTMYYNKTFKCWSRYQKHFTESEYMELKKLMKLECF